MIEFVRQIHPPVVLVQDNKEFRALMPIVVNEYRL